MELCQLKKMEMEIKWDPKKMATGIPAIPGLGVAAMVVVVCVLLTVWVMAAEVLAVFTTDMTDGLATSYDMGKKATRFSATDEAGEKPLVHDPWHLKRKNAGGCHLPQRAWSEAGGHYRGAIRNQLRCGHHQRPRILLAAGRGVCTVLRQAEVALSVIVNRKPGGVAEVGQGDAVGFQGNGDLHFGTPFAGLLSITNAHRWT